MNYIRTHWRGEQLVAWSLGVNLVLIRVFVLYCDQYTLPPYVLERADAIVASVIFGVVCHGVVYPWQVIGLVRACERRSGGIHSGVWAWSSYLAIIVSLVFTLLGIFGTYQALRADKFTVDDPLALEHARASQYVLSLEPTGKLVHIKGTMALGMTEKLKTMLDHNPDISGVVLSSEGGQVYEGRGVARLIRQRNLATYVFDMCSSACATAFIGGTERTLGARAKLGFHQYGLELWYPIPLFNLKEEQQKEISFYRQQNIAESFLSKVFRSKHEDIWFPDHNKLLDAGVVHHIITE